MRKFNTYEKAGAVVGAAVVAGAGLLISHSVEGSSNKPKPAASSSPTPSPEKSSAAPQLDRGEKELRSDTAKNSALIITASQESGQLVFHTQPNLKSKVAETLQPGQAEVFVRNVSQLNRQEGNDYWIGAIVDGSKGKFVWFDTSKAPQSSIKDYYPQDGSPEEVKVQFDGTTFESTDVDGPVVTAYGPVAADKAYDTYVKPNGFAAPTTDFN